MLKLCSSGSIYSITASSIVQFVSNSSQVMVLDCRSDKFFLVNIILLSLTLRTGLVTRPPSLHTLISIFLISNTTAVYILIIPVIFILFKSEYNSLGVSVTPIQEPLINTLVLLFMVPGVIFPICSTRGSIYSYKDVTLEYTVICAI